MLEKTHELKIPLLLPGIENEDDAGLGKRDGGHRHGRRRH